ncbi:MAG TPA: M20/M25/M40 family metallo-hydrolase, partial [Bacteroidia bacterium]|nr:M20/M25/M40 family metallo-hydrolase [Bacteroidia bacterium]
SGLKIHVKGLTGGHSGMDIHKGRGNANKIMNRILSNLSERVEIRINSIDGGSLRNAIPRESVAVLSVPANQVSQVTGMVKDLAETLKKENHTTDPNLVIETSTVDNPALVITLDLQKNFIRSVYACPNGIYRMSPDIQDLVQTSNNVARILVKDGSYSIQCLTRSAVDSEKMDLAQAIKSSFELIGANISFAGSYPGWAPAPESSIVKLMSGLYVERYKEKPHVNACHAGLECGIIGANYPNTEMISFGPNITGAHSPDEKVQVSSVQKFWSFLLETLKRMPEAN